MIATAYWDHRQTVDQSIKRRLALANRTVSIMQG